MRHLLLAFFLFSSALNAYSSKEITLNISGTISQLRTHANHLYLIDSKHSKIWKLNHHGKVLAMFDSKGEGPKELMQITFIQFLNDGMNIFSNNKCIKTDFNLKFLKEIKTEHPYLLLKCNTKIFCKRTVTHNDISYVITTQLPDKKTIPTLSLKIPKDGSKMSAITPFVSTKIIPSKNYFAIINQDLNGLNIFSDKGVLLNKIKLDISKTLLSDKFKTMFFESLFRDPRFQDNDKMKKMASKMISFPQYLPALQDFYIDTASEKIYVKTYKREENKAIFHIYNLKGKKIGTILLKDQFIDIANQSNFIEINNGIYYYLYENNDGDYIIYKNKI